MADGEYSLMYKGPEVDAILSRAIEGGPIDQKILYMQSTALAAVESAVTDGIGRVDAAAQEYEDVPERLGAAESGIATLETDLGTLDTREREHYAKFVGDMTAHALAIQTEVTDRQTADTALQTSINTLTNRERTHYQENRDRLDTLESSVAAVHEDESSHYAELYEVINGKAGLHNEVSENSKSILQIELEQQRLSDNIDAEISRAEEAEAALSGRINTEAADRQTADTALGGRITAETTRAQTAESSLRDALSSEISRAKAADTQEQEDIANLQQTLLKAATVTLTTEAGEALTTEDDAPIQGTTLVANTDPTLSVEFRAADAKATGDALAAHDAAIASLRAADDTESRARASADTRLREDITTLYAQSDTTQAVLDILTDTRTVTLTTEAGEALTTEDGSPLQGDTVTANTDKTLKVEDVAADAKATGDAVQTVKSAVQSVEKTATESYNALFDYRQYLYIQSPSTKLYYLPVLHLTGNFAAMSKTQSQAISYTSTFMGSGTGTCKWQGSSSIGNPKKNFTVTFNTPVDPFGWGAWKKLVLKGNFTDPSHSKNVVYPRLWASIVKAITETSDQKYDEPLTTEDGETLTTEDGTSLTMPFYQNPITRAPNYGATNGYPILLTINGEFTGLYTVQIPKDEWMFGMQNGDAGQAVVNMSNFVFTTPITNPETTFSSALTIEYASDDMTQTVIAEKLNRFINYLNSVKSASDLEDFGDYMNLDIATAYYVYSCYNSNVDGISRNFNIYTFDGGDHWNISSYDMDIAGGGWWQNPLRPGYGTNFTTDMFQAMRRNKIFDVIYRYGRDKLKQTYQTLTSTGGLLGLSNTYLQFAMFFRMIPKGAYDLDARRWPMMVAQELCTFPVILAWHTMAKEELDSIVATWT